MNASSIINRSVGLILLFVSSSLAHSQSPLLLSEALEWIKAPQSAALRHLKYNSEDVRQLLSDGDHELRFLRWIRGETIHTLRFQHYYKGIKVLGSVASVHIRAEHLEPSKLLALRPMSSLHLSTPELSTQASLSENDALRILKTHHNDQIDLQSKIRLEILTDEERSSSRLVYIVQYRTPSDNKGYTVHLDAHSGAMLLFIPSEHHIAPIYVKSLKNTEQVIDESSGAPMRIDWDGAKLEVSEGVAEYGASEASVRAARNSDKVYKFYKTHFNRDSYDDQGSPLVSLVHVGRNFANAYWDSHLNVMAYGEGDGQYLRDFTHALDVAGHEVTHGVISSTADLLYAGESGALNEALADFFGSAIEGKNWAIGEDLFVSPDSASLIRDIAEPSRLTAFSVEDEQGQVTSISYPSHMRDRLVARDECSPENDLCFVHINSTIFSHATFQISERIGLEKTARILYLALTQILTERSGFRHARKSVVDACGMLYSGSTCASVVSGLSTVGL